MVKVAGQTNEVDVGFGGWRAGFAGIGSGGRESGVALPGAPGSTIVGPPEGGAVCCEIADGAQSASAPASPMRSAAKILCTKVPPNDCLARSVEPKGRTLRERDVRGQQQVEEAAGISSRFGDCQRGWAEATSNEAASTAQPAR